MATQWFRRHLGQPTGRTCGHSVRHTATCRTEPCGRGVAARPRPPWRLGPTAGEWRYWQGQDAPPALLPSPPRPSRTAAQHLTGSTADGARPPLNPRCRPPHDRCARGVARSRRRPRARPPPGRVPRSPPLRSPRPPAVAAAGADTPGRMGRGARRGRPCRPAAGRRTPTRRRRRRCRPPAARGRSPAAGAAHSRGAPVSEGDGHSPRASPKYIISLSGSLIQMTTFLSHKLIFCRVFFRVRGGRDARRGGWGTATAASSKGNSTVVQRPSS